MKKPPHQYDAQYNRNLLIAFAIISIMMGFWYYFYEIPHRHRLYEEQMRIKAEVQFKQQEMAKLAGTNESDRAKNAEAEKAIAQIKDRPRDEVIAESPRIKINTAKLHGSINLKGGRIDDITLAKYKATLDKNSLETVLLSPPTTTDSAFIESGWISDNKDLKAPDSEALWQADGNNVLSENNPVILKWDNGQGFIFTTTYSIDKDYMFTVEQKVQNNSATSATFYPYALISKAEPKTDKPPVGVLHTGPMGVMDGTLTEVSYKALRDDKSHEFPNSMGWIGISDKYWAKALVPPTGEKFKANFRYSIQAAEEKFQVDYLGDGKTVAPGAAINYAPKIFAGAKELNILEGYADNYKIPLFERLIDFGWFHFLSKPMMHALIFFYHLIGNYGLAILSLTLCVKLLLFPLARKSYISMGRMRDIMPEVQKLREKYKTDKMELNKQIMELYKKKKVNPASGCLPVLLQMPIFFALYKVFYVSIEMRHTPFFGWVKDLSAQDATSIFNLFGLIPIHLPEYLIIGAWPCIWAITMYIQQKISPPMTDPAQAKMMKFLPIVLVFIFAKMPAGLVIYWTFSNTLTICQQLYFLKYHGQKS